MTQRPNVDETTLADIDTRIGVFSSMLPRAGGMAARRAAARIAQAAGTTPAMIPAAEALERFDAIRNEVPASCYADERTYLRRALTLPELPPDAAQRIASGAATFADAALAVGLCENLGDERGRINGALKALAKRIGAAMDQLQARTRFVDSKLAELTHADFAMEPSSYANFRSRIRRGVGLVDLQSRQRLSTSLLTGPWRELVILIKGKQGETEPGREGAGGDLAKLWPLIEYCHNRGIAPEAVGDNVIAELRAELAQRERVDPFALARNVVYAWERLQRSYAAFPRQELSRLYRTARSPNGVPIEQLPERFQQSWNAYVTERFGSGGLPASLVDCIVPETSLENLLDAPENSLFRRSLCAVPNFRTVVTYGANAALAAGRYIETLRDILVPEVLKAILVAAHARQKARAAGSGQPCPAKNNTLYHMATLFIAMARDLEVSGDEFARMIEMRDVVDPHLLRKERRVDGSVRRVRSEWKIGPRHATRLRQFNDPVKLLAWYNLPHRLLNAVKERVEAGKEPTLEQVNDVIVAILLFFGRCCPVRRQNTATLMTYGPRANLLLTGDGTGYVHVDAPLVKNHIDLDMHLTRDAAAAIRFLLDHCRPILAQAVGAAPDNPYLFPAAGTSYRSPSLLNHALMHRCQKLGGFELNMHVQRHLAAKIVLDADPSKMAMVQRLLGHKSIKTTMAHYAQVNSIVAQRQFQSILEAHINELRALSNRRR